MSGIVGCTLMRIVAAGVLLADTAATAERPFREAFVVESDGTAEKKLAAVEEYVAQERWDTAIALLREVAAARPDAVVQVSPRHSVSLAVYCDILLSRLPAEGLAAYRRGIDPQAAIWLAGSEAEGDERSLRMIVGRAFGSSVGDEAVFRLAERCRERGEFDLARRHWTSLIPVAGDAAPLPPVLRYPDTNLDIAAIRARLVLCSVALGEWRRAESELVAFRRLHPETRGTIGGREARLADLLAELLSGRQSAARLSEAPLPAQGTATFGVTTARSGFVPTEPASRRARWFRSLPASVFVTDQGRPALPPAAPLSHYPVVWRDKVFVADAERVFGFDLGTGKAAWAAAEDDAGVVYSPGDVIDPADRLRFQPSGPLIGVPRHTLTVDGDRLYARLGPPVTAWPARDLRRPESKIVCLDLAREGLLTWSVGSETLGGADESWSFEGPPAAADGRLYLLAIRTRPQVQLNAICVEATTGVILWNRRVGAPIASPPEGAAVMTHRVVTVAAGRLYIQTNHGAVICLDPADGRPLWVGWYESRPPESGPPASAPDRNLPGACLFAGGVVVAAPADSERLFAYDAESGIELWSRGVRGGGRELVGAKDGVLVVSGERLTGLDLFTGRELWSVGFEDPPGYGAGKGLLAGRFAYWPTREDLLVVDLSGGELVRRVPLAKEYGFVGGGNLAASAAGLVMGRADGVLGFGD
jgi:outer membrane protein assembly factor BamB